jgi:glycosyltransferase involved in cell wall biosynthesis
LKSLLIITQYFKPELGAPQNRLFETSQAFKEKGWEVKILTAMPNYPHGEVFEGFRGAWTRKENLEGVEVHRSWIFPSNSTSAIPRIFSMLSFSLSIFSFLFTMRKWKPNIVFVESPPLLLGLAGKIFSDLTKSKYWFNVSDIWPLSAKELGAIKDGWLYSRLEDLENYIYKRSDFITGQSEEIVAHINETGNTAFLFRNGVDIKRFENHGEKDEFQNDNPRIVYAGLLGFAQGILAIVKNIDFKNLGLEFHIYGSGSEQKKLEEILADNPDRGVFFHGQIEREDIPKMLTGYDGYLIPLVKNIYGAVPSKTYEAMASGIPILFFGDGEGAKIVRENNVGWTVKPRDFDGLTMALKDFRLKGELRAEMKINGKNTARSKFNRAQILNTMIRELESKLL